MYLPNSPSGHPVYRGSQSFTISDFVFTGSNPGGCPSRSQSIGISLPMGQSECLVIAAAGVAEDVVEPDRRADDDQAGRDRAALGAGDDDPVVAADAPRRGREIARIEGRGDEADPRVIGIVEVKVGHGVDP